MSKLAYSKDGQVTTCFTMQEIEKIRDNALMLTYQGFHPRYQLPINDLFKAADAILLHMKQDEAKSCSTSKDEKD